MVVRAFGTAHSCGRQRFFTSGWVKKKKTDMNVGTQVASSISPFPQSWISAYAMVLLIYRNGSFPDLQLPGNSLTDMPRGVSPG